MLSMQNQGVGAARLYDQYQYIVSGLALWHLQFNYLKMVLELFYLGRSSIEWLMLQ